MPSASTIVMLARLRFFARLLTTPLHLAQFFAMAAYKAPGSWLSQVVGDLECLRVRMASRLSDMPRPEDDLKPWLQLIRSSTSTWERTLKLLDRYTERPAVPSLASPHTLLAEDGEFVCACGKTFNSQVLLNAHNVRYHGYRHLARYYMFDDHVCYCCLTCYPHRDRAVQHLMERPTCLRTLQSLYTPQVNEEVSRRDEAAVKARHARKSSRVHQRPAFRFHGPSIQGWQRSHRIPFS